MPSIVNNPEEKKDTKVPKQGEKETGIVEKIREKFTLWKYNSNRSFSHFGLNHDGSERDLLDVIDYSNRLVDGYRVKPAWKEDWQANSADITLHSKLMAVLANIISQKFIVEYHPRFNRDRNAVFMSNVLDDFARYIFTEERNSHIDQLFSALKCLREPESIKYIGYKKTAVFEGIDYQFVKPEEFYPERLDTFFLKDIHRCIWRKVWDFQTWKDERSGKGFIDIDKVKEAGAIRSDTTSFFDVSMDLRESQVEELIWFDEFSNEWFIVANDILISKLDNKLTDISPGKVLPFVKTSFEPFSPHFFHGRSLSMIMGPTQEAIDYMFNGMFDKTMIDVMRPILVGGINDLVDDYIAPGVLTEVADVKQIKELDIKPLDLTAFRVLKELQDRNTFASVDAAGQGKVSLGSPTATEINTVREASQKIFGMFFTMLTDMYKQEYTLVGHLIINKYFKRKDFDEFFIENTKLRNKKIGTRVVRIMSENKLPIDRDERGLSPSLVKEGEIEYDGETEITAFAPTMFKDYKFRIEARLAPVIENSKALKKAFLNQKLVQMYSLPQLYDPQVVKKIDVENNKDILGEFADELLEFEQEEQGIPGLPNPLSAGQTSNQMLPQVQKSAPNLDKLLASEGI